MNCDFSIELLSSYLDGELDEKQRAVVEEHLRKCQHCKNTIEEWKLLGEHIRNQEIEEPSREFIFSLNRRILEKVKKKPHFFVFRYTPIFAPAAVALLVLIVFINLNQRKKLIGIDDRILYAEITSEEKLDLWTPKLKIHKKAEAKKIIVANSKKEIAAGAFETAEIAPASESPKRGKIDKKEEKDVSEFFVEADLEDLEIPRDRITRAIIDSTGRVLKVATGNTIIPEKDTVLENCLQGQQLTPPTISGRKTQMYVDLTPKSLYKNNLEDVHKD